MVTPYISYYHEVEFGEDMFEKWHPHKNNFDRNKLLFTLGISFRNDPRNAMTLFDFNLVHKDSFNKQNITPDFPEWIVCGEFSWQKVYPALERFVEDCSAESEEKCFEKLRMKFFWEYDGYNGQEEIPPKNMFNYIG